MHCMFNAITSSSSLGTVLGNSDIFILSMWVLQRADDRLCLCHYDHYFAVVFW
jgi:hypothetical protein